LRYLKRGLPATPAIFIVSLFVLFSLSANAQCTHKLADLPAAPELLGFRLGMTKEEVKAMVPQTRFGGKDAFGVSKTTINPYFDETIDKEKFPAVRSVSLDFLDNRLTSLWIGFDNTFKIQDLDQLAASLSQSLRITGAWQPWKSRGKQMRCADFEVNLQFLGGGPSIRILDTLADDSIAARRQAKAELDSEIEEAVAAGANEMSIVIGDRKAKTYFRRTCYAANELSGDSRVVFKTIEEAEKAGFKPSQRCD